MAEQPSDQEPTQPVRVPDGHPPWPIADPLPVWREDEEPSPTDSCSNA